MTDQTRTLPQIAWPAVPATAELDALKAAADEKHAAFKQRGQVPIEAYTRSGYVAYFDHAGARYSLSTFLCNCAELSITLSSDNTPREYLNATYTCATHGAHQSTAIRCAAPSVTHTDSAAFAWVEQRHRRDRRVQWGMARHSLPSTFGGGAGGEGGGQS
jgi:hypothetical protein